MPWLPDGCATCDTCGKLRIGLHERKAAIQAMRAGGWHHSKGLTIGGVPYEVILCPGCAKDERKRQRNIVVVDQDSLFDVEEYGKIERGQGVQSR
jgi:hypothetical protein